MRILLIEDDDGIAEPLVGGLTRAGFDVVRVATGAAALDEAGSPDVVLLDLILPDIDGYAVCHQLRAEFEILVIDRRARKIFVDDREVDLSKKEFDLLALLAENPDEVVSWNTLIEEVWGPDWNGPVLSIYVRLAHLRRKLEHPEWVKTVRRVGLHLGDTEG